MSGISTSLTSAVGGLAPPGIGGVAGRARDPLVPDRAPLGGVQPPRAPVPGASQAGPLPGLQHCSPPPHYSTGLLSHSASSARLEEHQIMTQLAAGTRKGTKRAAAGPSPASPPKGKKKKKGGKKASRPKKVKAAKPHKEGRSGAVSDSDLLAMMQLVAGRHGWSIGEPPASASQGLTQATLDPATSAPPPVPPAGQAALYMAPPPAPQTGQATSYHTTMAPPPAMPAGQAALYSMTTAPPPGFPAGQQPPLFPLHRAPATLGAPPGEELFPPQAPTVPADVFTQSEGSVITETSHSDWSTLQGPATTDPDVWSVTSGAPSLAEQEATPGLRHGNPLRRRQFSEEDKCWTNMSYLTRSSMRLAAYAGALTNLAVQADDLHVSREDRMLLNSLLFSISELMFKQATRASLYTTHRRRDLALSALGFSERHRAQLTRDMPCEGPYCLVLRAVLQDSRRSWPCASKPGNWRGSSASPNLPGTAHRPA